METVMGKLDDTNPMYITLYQKHLDETNLLVRWANLMTDFYGHATYLVGSALIKDNPRDYDIVIIIPDVEFELRYKGLNNGDVKDFIQDLESGLWRKITWNWSDDCVHKSLHGMQYTWKYIDFKIFPESYQEYFYKGKLMLRIDTIMREEDL